MDTTRALLVAAELVSATLAGVAVALAWRRRAMTPAAVPFALTQAVIMGWALAAAYGFAFPGLVVSRVTELVSLVVSTSSGYFFLWFGLTLAGSPHRRQRQARGTALVVVAVTAVAAVTEPWHHLMYGPHWHGPRPLPPFGPLYWVFGAISSAAVPVVIVVLVRLARRGSAAERRSAALVIGGMLTSTIPTLVDAAVEGYPRRELIPIWLIGTGLLYLVAMLQSGMLGLVPLARHQVLERISDAVVTVDLDGRVIDTNPAARRLFGTDRPVLPQTDGRHELALTVDGRRVDLQITRDPLHDRRGHRVGAVLVATDVTELNEKTARLEESNTRLREQLQTISTLRAELAELAVRDELTGLHNRRYLTGRLDEAVDAAGRSGGPVSVVVFDVDHFKRVNDTFGHNAGDQVLRAIADVLAGSTRAGDVISRHGGEEFVLLMPGCPEAAALERAEQLRRRIQDVAVPVGDQELLSLTVSAGVATVRPEPAEDPSERSVIGAALIAAADRALYRAKESGRNQVLCAPLAA